MKYYEMDISCLKHPVVNQMPTKLISLPMIFPVARDEVYTLQMKFLESLSCPEATICWIAACMTTLWAAVPWGPCVPRNLKLPLTYGGRGMDLRCFGHVRTLKWSYCTTCLAFCGDSLEVSIA